MPVLIDNFATVIEHYAPTVPEFYFIQVGANDGRSGDPIYSHVRRWGWRGVAIEPQRWVFAQLAQTYRDVRGVELENVAIADADGWRDLYKIAFSNQRWATGLASLREEEFLGERMKRYIARHAGRRNPLPEREEDYYTVERVRTMTFDTLIDKHRPDRIDLLQIDAEGYDDRLLQMYDFHRLRPSIVQYEQHLTPEGDRLRTRRRLSAFGYRIFPDYINAVAVHQTVASALQAHFPSEYAVGDGANP